MGVVGIAGLGVIYFLYRFLRCVYFVVTGNKKRAMISIKKIIQTDKGKSVIENLSF